MARIGILTGGGDCPGLNAVIRAVVRRAVLGHGWEVIGIAEGFRGLIERESRPLTLDDTRGLLTRGGTILGATNRADPFAYREAPGAPVRDRSDEVVSHARELGLDVVIVVGGDGTQHIANRLVAKGLPAIGVPKTIDNDLPATETTFGFNTAVETVVYCIDKLQTTAESHDRVMICEVMGRDTGWIALSAGLASGADVILIPEIPYDIDRVVATIDTRKRGGRNFTIIVVAEGASPRGGGVSVSSAGDATRLRRLGGAGERLAADLGHRIEHEIRVTVLGHIQRGGTPSAFDRLLGTRFGEAAVDLFANGQCNRMVVVHRGEIDSVPLADVMGTRHVDPDGDLVGSARGVGIELGG